VPPPTRSPSVSPPTTPPPSGSTATALHARRQQPRRRFWLRPLTVLPAAGLLALLTGWLLLGSSVLSVQEVTVSGERTLSQRDVLAAAHVQLGTPLVRVDLTGIQQRVAALAPVARVSVHRAWPHTVAISVIERKPVATLRSPPTGWDVVDKAGVIFRHLPRQPDLPVIDVPSTRDRPVLAAAAAVVAALPPRLLARIHGVTARTVDDVTLHLTGGREVRWGSEAASTLKVRVLRVLLKQTAHIYDVSVPAQPTTAR
jgi:cell division protein FtsQ